MGSASAPRQHHLCHSEFNHGVRLPDLSPCSGFSPLPSGDSQGVSPPGAADALNAGGFLPIRQGDLTKGFYQLSCACRRCK